MMMCMMMMCKRLAQVPMLCVPIYNMKLAMAMMQKTLIFTTFSAHTKMAAEKRGQNEVFARNILHIYIYIISIISIIIILLLLLFTKRTRCNIHVVVSLSSHFQRGSETGR